MGAAERRAFGLQRPARALAHHHVLCGLRTTGLVAPLVLDGAMNGPAFLAYTQQFLVPTLRPGDIVVLDNSARTRWPACSRQSSKRGRRCSICHRTVRT